MGGSSHSCGTQCGMEQTYQMVTAEGVQKGMRMVLEERGLDTRGMDAKKMREQLHQFQASYNVT